MSKRIKTYRFSAWNSFGLKESNTWENIIKAAKKMAKNQPTVVVEVKDHTMPAGKKLMESFIWDEEKNDIVPHYGKGHYS